MAYCNNCPASHPQQNVKHIGSFITHSVIRVFAMANYDEVFDFDYTDENAWKEFAVSDILPLYTAALNITEFSRYLKEKLKNSFSDAFLENEGIQKMLLGGVTVDGEYAENSLARFYRDHIGVHIDPDLWVSLCKEPGTETLQNIEVQFSLPPILAKLNTILDLTGVLLRSVGHILPEIDEDAFIGFIQVPERIADEFAVVYSQLIKISATYNYHTFFAMSTRSTPKFFLLEAYPQLKVHFEAVAELLGLGVVDIPEADKTVYQGDMVLIKHDPKGFADSLYQLNQIAWEDLSLFALSNCQSPPLRDEFIEIIQMSNTDLKPPNEAFEARKYYLTDNGRNVLGYVGTSKGKFHRVCEMSLQHFLRITAPYLFVGRMGLENRIAYRGYEIDTVGYRSALYIFSGPSNRYRGDI